MHQIWHFHFLLIYSKNAENKKGPRVPTWLFREGVDSLLGLAGCTPLHHELGEAVQHELLVLSQNAMSDLHQRPDHLLHLFLVHTSQSSCDQTMGSWETYH